MNYDVIIVGAGPAGLKCAEILGNSKYRVLLVEKNSEIGPKVCAGGLTILDLSYLDLSKDLIEFQSNRIKYVVNENEFDLISNQLILSTIERKYLGQWQLKRLEKFSNITIRKNAEVTEVYENCVRVNNKKIKFKYLVGADGSESIVRKYLGLKTEKRNIAMQYLIPKKFIPEKYNAFRIFLNSRLFSSGYTWIFPHKKYVSVGICGNPKFFSIKQLKKNFKKWLDKKNIDVSNAKYEASEINYDYRGYHFENIFLVGDAGGFSSGLTGEGIYFALISGAEVAKKILDPDYNPKMISEILKRKKKEEFILRVFQVSGILRTFVFYLYVLFLKLLYTLQINARPKFNSKK